ncbi:MAG: aminopeptidase, partial [Candidatus Aenigmatarchaeota archaeon]
MKAAAKACVETCLKIRPKENVLVVSEGKEKVADAIAAACEEKGAFVRRATVALKRHREEPPKNIEYALMESDAAFLVTEHSLSHTNAVREACRKGIRIASMPGIDEEMFARAVKADYRVMRRAAEVLANILLENDSIVISAAGGTSIRLKRGGREVHLSDGIIREGDSINLPDGEVYFAPLENSVNGRIVVDGCASPDTEGEFGKIGQVTEPLVLTVKEGRVIKIEGGRHAEILKNSLKALNDSGAYQIAELGIGINPKAKLTQKILESEKAAGTVHFALGENCGFGGIN